MAMDVLNSLQNLVVTRPNLDELMFLSHTAVGLRKSYDEMQVDVPEWLDNSIRELKREIHTRQQDQRDNAIRTIKARLDALKTPTEKRTELEEQLKRLTLTATGS